MDVYVVAFIFITVLFLKGVTLALEIRSNNKLIKALRESQAAAEARGEREPRA